MIWWLRDFRFVPIALIATSGLLALKLLGLVLVGGYAFEDTAARSGDDIDVTGTVSDGKPREPPVKIIRDPPPKPSSWAHEMFNFPDITGSVAGGTPAPAPAPAAPAEPASGKRPAPQEPPATRGWTPIPTDTAKSPSPAERERSWSGCRSAGTNWKPAVATSTCAKV